MSAKDLPQLKPDQVMIADEYAYRRARRGRSVSPRMAERFKRSAAQVVRRQKSVPKKVDLLEDLPIHGKLNQITDLVRNNQVVIVAGETGSGKTTQLPLALLKAGFGVRGTIGHTQPRRLAARSVAQRIADQTHSTLGQEVGYAFRFEERWTKDTLVKVMTDGMLLNDIRSDRFLNQYEVLIVDEAHERSLNIDFLLGVLKRLLKSRQDLRVIVTSATIDVDAFCDFFGGAPAVSVEGRGFPVTIQYRDPKDDAQESVLSCLSELANENSDAVRDILLFLPTEREILDWSTLIRRRFPSEFEVLPLYARLPPRDQQRIFTQGKKQRVLLATNVAETSLTVPGIRYVIDLGLARISRYSSRSRVQRLPIEQISQASANQRAGRCGRVASGTCYRIYSQDTYLDAAEYTEPEIKRSNLSAVVLQAANLKLGDLSDFPFIDPPQPHSIAEAKKHLVELGALRDQSLTQVGKQLAQLNIDPRLGRMLIEASRRGALREVSIIVAALAIQDPRVRPLNKQVAADDAHAEFKVPRSDFLSLVKMWDMLETERRSLSAGAFRRLLDRKFISPSRYQEWRSMHRQLLDVCRRLKLNFNKAETDFAATHTSILAGSLFMVGFKQQKGLYQGPQNLSFRIFPGSAVRRKEPTWIVSSEVVETSQLFARNVAEIKPAWIEKVGRHLLSNSYVDPYWDDRRREPMVFCNGSLHGLPVVVKRPTRLALSDRAKAHRMFIEHALVKGREKTRYEFLDSNLILAKQLADVQERERVRDVIVRDSTQVQFYATRLPDSVVSSRSFNAWFGKASQEEIASLFMTESDLRLRPDKDLHDQAYPSQLKTDQYTADLVYRFASGEKDDGVSLRVRLDDLLKVRDTDLPWLVPGFLPLKCELLLQSLPKKLRRAILPIKVRVEELLAYLLTPERYRQGDFFVEIARFLNNRFEVVIDPNELRATDLPAHLRMNVQVLDHDDQVIDQDRDVDALCERTISKVETQVTPDVFVAFEQRALTHFPEAGLPETIEVSSEKGAVTLYPELIDRGETVELLMRATPILSQAGTFKAICRLVLIAERQSVKYLQREFSEEKQLELEFATVASPNEVFDWILLHAVAAHYFENGNVFPRTRSEFEERVEPRCGSLIPVCLSLFKLAAEVVNLRFQVTQRINKLTSKAFVSAKADLEQQLHRLVPADFMYASPPDRVKELPRYLKSMLVRAENLQGRVDRDAEWTQSVHQLESRLDLLYERSTDLTPLKNLHFDIEELRVSLFNQALKRKKNVSHKKILANIEQLEFALPNSR